MPKLKKVGCLIASHFFSFPFPVYEEVVQTPPPLGLDSKELEGSGMLLTFLDEVIRQKQN